ncbi:SNF2-related protein [Methylobacterium sp. J-068]|uniref:SNF2-related protein n=1 Tax=Methylobacterium sp. J-068 TaxID=2836649 RepID=UPI001FBB24D1|nr:SNF2-related protein [Methylobacterium sp. J-068]MCJ2035532.1 DEAD/DEAH box helicase [Methylobacterium sp. J-068]
MKPHQVEAALFALHSPITKGVILADEVGLGKTIEASLVIAQRWAENRRRILLVVPASLRKQWSQELHEKFSLASVIIETKSYRDAINSGKRPFEDSSAVIVTSYEFAAANASEIGLTPWDLVVFDEAHRLRNVYRSSGAARAKELRENLNGRFKILLTATPLQNSLMELFGLVSMIDTDFFGDKETFQTLYGGKISETGLTALRSRLGPIYKRHLRKDVQEAGHVSFTNRKVVTFNFKPADVEVDLYNGVSDYLQRSASVAFGGRPNPLLLTGARKSLGSSTAAIIGFLETVLARLKEREPISPNDLVDVGDVDEVIAEAREELGYEEKEESISVHATLAATETEIAEVEHYLALARGIGFNTKGEMLVAQLPALLNDVVSKGGRRKAVVFTESVRTQIYLAELLADGGFNGQVVLLNGSNSDPHSKKVYRDWVKRQVNSDAISGSKSADMKAAIVDAFKGEEASILIATESGAEGINLQFCSLLVNFDLPWNPQRVEQRIGRCHRYGQKLDVTVINFLNLRNKVEERVYELLRNKFKLFEGVFGVSDDVLGAIASGVHFERDILEIAQTCRTDIEIEDAFAKLEATLDASIASDMSKARRRLFDHLDQGVVAKLRARNETVVALLSDFEQWLLTVARAELPEAQFHSENGRCFDLDGVTWTTDWATADERGWRFFRLGDGEMASDIVARAATRDLPAGQVVFDSERLRVLGFPGFADVDRLKGQAGWIRVSCLVLRTEAESQAPREVFVFAAMTDDGVEVAPETVEHLFLTPGDYNGLTLSKLPSDKFKTLEQKHEILRTEEALSLNTQWLEEEDKHLEAQADDLIRSAKEKSKALNAEIKTAQKSLRTNTSISPEDAIKERKRIGMLKHASDVFEMETMTRRKKIQESAQENLDKMALSLKISADLLPLFTLRWEVV